MASFSAELHVAGQVFPVLAFDYGVYQETDLRGRVTTRVRYDPVCLRLSVPDGDLLLLWAADPHQRLLAYLVFLDADGGRALETLTLPAAYCVGYQETFVAGDQASGAYVCDLTLVDPSGFTLTAGGPGAYVTPAAREHGQPAGTASLAAATRWKGGAGPEGTGDIIGKYSGRKFNPDASGGPIIAATWQYASITTTGIATVQKHIARYGEDVENEAMITRLQQIAQGNLQATAWDERFYTHELREYERYRALGIADGVDPGREVWNNAHTATLEDFGLADYAPDGTHNLYHPEI